ncbi:MAG: hypothetical protein IPK17_37425 [Chloroflexi bacterium]|uniref:hypothetical protein n=1 Tax=Candidatus Flexifilum breve TaxID=3140694 RepID=UPI003136A0B7|nr:hypothetical protein [Chloroflexota bacterium]
MGRLWAGAAGSDGVATPIIASNVERDPGNWRPLHRGTGKLVPPRPPAAGAGAQRSDRGTSALRRHMGLVGDRLETASSVERMTEQTVKRYERLIY